MIGDAFRAPHEIPFRAASTARQSGPGVIEGTYLATFNDALACGPAPDLLLVEAMAQIAGALVFENSAAPAFLSGISEVRFSGPIVPGDRFDLTVTSEALFGGMHRFRGVAARDGVEFGSARFYLTMVESGPVSE